MHCKLSRPLLCVPCDDADEPAAYIYWDLGGDVTQYGSPEAIGKLVVLQFKANASLRDGSQVVANASIGSVGRPSHLGSCRYLHPRLGPRPLYSNISNQIFPHDLLCGPWHQRSIWRCHYSRRMSDLPTDFIQLGPLDTRWPLWISKIAGSFHWHIQSAHGRDCGRFADARAMGFANGCG